MTEQLFEVPETENLPTAPSAVPITVVEPGSSAFADEAIKQVVTIVGTIGSGKTVTGKGMVEYMLRQKRRVVVVDPTGVWWGLRLTPDGKDKSPFDIAILGGDHGDMPLTEDMGKKIGEIVATRNQPMVLDLSNMLQDEKRRFMLAFCETLFAKNKQALHLILDEADEFAPQNPMPETKRLGHYIDLIVRRGRARGFRVCMITQRPAVLHKNVLTQSNTMVVHRITSPQDRNAIDAWVKGNADGPQARVVTASLSSLERGTGWLWCPSLNLLDKVAFPFITTFDSSRTPDDGEEMPDVELTPLALEDLRVQLEPPPLALAGPDEEPPAAAAPGGKRGKAAPSIDVDAIRAAGFAEARDIYWPEGIKYGRDMALRGISAMRDRILGEFDGLSLQLNQPPPVVTDGSFVTPPFDFSAGVARFSMPAASIFGVAVDILSPAPKPATGARAAMLRVLDTNPPVTRTWAAVAALIGLKETGGGFRRAKRALVDGGQLIEVDFERGSGRGLSVRISLPSAGAPAMPHDPAQFVDFWADRLNADAPVEMLKALLTLGGAATATALAGLLNASPKSAKYRVPMKLLRDAQLVEQRGDKLCLACMPDTDAGA